MHITDNGLVNDESDTTSQAYLLERLKQVIAQVSMLSSNAAFQGGQADLCSALCALMAVEEDWKYEHEMLKAEFPRE